MELATVCAGSDDGSAQAAAASCGGGGGAASPPSAHVVLTPLAPPTTPTTPPARPLVGLSLAGFEALIAAAGGRCALAGKSTEWLKTHVILPATMRAGFSCSRPCADAGACRLAGWQHEEAAAEHSAGCGSSYAELLRARPDGGALVGDASAFISHTYDY